MTLATLLDNWPALAITALISSLGLFSWSRRAVPGAKPFAVACLFNVLWLVAVLIETLASDSAVRIFFFKVEAVAALTVVTAMTSFTLEYANPGRWLTRRNLTLLWLPTVLGVVLALTNDWHYLGWRDVPLDGLTQPPRGIAGDILLAYGWGLVIVNVSVFVWLMIRSPQHHWPVALMVFGQVTGRVLFAFHMLAGAGDSGPELMLLAFAVPFGMYGIALFGFRIFDPLPAARRAALEQMRDGMLVLDTDWRVLSLNASARSALGAVAGRARGAKLERLLPALPDLRAHLTGGEEPPPELLLETSGGSRRVRLDLSPLRDHTGFTFGFLLLLRDVTDQHAAQEQALARQWAEATLQEREQLAHELHDGLSQSLAFVNLQAQAAQLYLQSGQGDEARASLNRLGSVAREMHGDVRELISNLLSVTLPADGFCSALSQVVTRFQEHNDLPVALEVDPSASIACDAACFSPTAGVQLLRIVQEALANVRKHAGRPSRVTVRLRSDDGRLALTVEDDGVGFDTGAPTPEGGHFGLQVMRQRAERIGGEIAVRSSPGAGTVVEVLTPLAGAAQARQL